VNRKRVAGAIVPPSERPGPTTPPRWKERYLALIRKTGNYAKTARAVGVSPRTAQRERDRDPEFNELCLEAVQEAADDLEDRMVAGAEASGNPAGFIVRLKALRPAQYIEKHAVLSLSADLNELPVQDALSVLRGMLGTTTITTTQMISDGTAPRGVDRDAATSQEP
jgi:hypothetical protein